MKKISSKLFLIAIIALIGTQEACAFSWSYEKKTLGDNISISSKYKSSAVDYTSEFDISELSDIETDLSSSDFTIKSSENNSSKVLVTVKATEGFDKLIKISKEDRVLRIEQLPSHSKKPIWIEVIVQVPEKSNLKYELSSSSGDIRASKILCRNFTAVASSGDITVNDITNISRIKTSSGSISLKADKIEKSLSLQASSGDIEVDIGQISKGLRVNTSSGETTAFIESLSGNLDAVSSSGDMVYKIGKLNGDISATASSGSLKFSLPKDARISGTLNTSSGDIDCDFPAVFSTRGKSARIQGGDDYAVAFETSSGNILIRR